MLKNLKLLRTEKNVSQQQLADVVGVSQQSINKYENHSVEPDIDTLIKISDFFSVSVDFLIGRTDIRTVPCNMTEYSLNKKEKNVIDGYRKAQQKDREIIDFIIKSYI